VALLFIYLKLNLRSRLNMFALRAFAETTASL